KTTNGGQSWTVQTSVFCPALGPNLAAIAASGSTGVAVGGSVYRRDPNTPAEWVLVVPNPASGGLAAVSHASGNEYWAVGGNSTVIRSLDGGTTWNPVDTSNGFASGLALKSVAMINSSSGFVVGSDATGAGRAFRVQNAVTAPLWVEVTPTCPTTAPAFEDVAVRSAGGITSYAVGLGGAIFKYNRSADRFAVVPDAYVPASCATISMPAAQLTTSDLHAVELPVGSSDVWIGGDFGTVLRFATSGGWTLPKSGTSKDVLGISFPSSGRGYIAGQTLPGNGSTTAFADGVLIRTP
ncbi:MAG: hypothetical protein HYR85_12090, partial [Planctomycetes bacterium]|nr:hypothetical protein [Planctomycetota bacterium]